jgi:hypothetical protein
MTETRSETSRTYRKLRRTKNKAAICHTTDGRFFVFHEAFSIAERIL